MTDRDPAVAAALATLDVPEHGAAFWDDLDALLAPPVSHRRWRRQALRITTVAAAVAVLAAALSGGLGDENGPVAPRPASAAEVARQVSAALAAADTLRGTLVLRDAEGDAGRTAFVTTATGDLRLETTTARGERNVIAYDAARGVEKGYWLPGPGGGFGSYGGVRTGLAPVQTPDQGPADWVLRMDLAATLRAATGEPATETTFAGRPAWLLEADVQPQDSAGDQAVDHIAATIDKETAFPVRVVETRNGRLVREMTVEGLVTGPPAARAEFDVEFPPGTQVTRTDGGFVRTTLDAARASHRVLAPAALPDGYVLSEVAVAERGGPTGVEGTNPPAREVVSLLYRRGFDRVLVTTRLRSAGEWSDPMASGEGIKDTPEPLTLAGALAGARAELVVNAQGTAPHVWALTGTLVVTVSGDLTRAELLDVAGSLAG